MIKYVILGFLLLELSNVLILYFFPDSKLANGMGTFKAWDKSKVDTQVHDLVLYLVNWVAGTKLIFIGLLALILDRYLSISALVFVTDAASSLKSGSMIFGSVSALSFISTCVITSVHDWPCM